MIEDFFHLPPVSTTPVVHLDLRISPRIFEKNRNGSIGILRGLGETDSWKKQKSKTFKVLIKCFKSFLQKKESSSKFTGSKHCWSKVKLLPLMPTRVWLTLVRIFWVRNLEFGMFYGMYCFILRFRPKTFC